MANIMIKDLIATEELGAEALANVVGGISFGWIVPYQNQPSGRPGGLPVQVTQYFQNFDIDVTEVFQTVNQIQYVNLDTSNIFESNVNILVDQGQFGLNE